VPRARAAEKIANGAGLDALDPGQKRALGLTPDGFPLDAAGLVEVGLEQPLVSLGEAGRPVLAPAPPGRTLPAPGSRWIRGRASGGSTSCGGISKSPIPRPERTRFRHHLADRNPIHPFKT